MDRSFWLSLMALGLGIAVLLSGRAMLDGLDYVNGVNLAAEVERLQGAPSSQELADRVTEAAGCIYGDRPPVRTCWYAWIHPEDPRFLAIIAQRVQDDSGGSALAYLLWAMPFWLLAAYSGWKATRPVRPFRPSLIAGRTQPLDPPAPQGRLIP
jgi:hypothetical protein